MLTFVAIIHRSAILVSVQIGKKTVRRDVGCPHFVPGESLYGGSCEGSKEGRVTGRGEHQVAFAATLQCTPSTQHTKQLRDIAQHCLQRGVCSSLMQLPTHATHATTNTAVLHSKLIRCSSPLLSKSLCVFTATYIVLPLTPYTLSAYRTTDGRLCACLSCVLPAASCRCSHCKLSNRSSSCKGVSLQRASYKACSDGVH